VLSLSAGGIPDLVCGRKHDQPDCPACGRAGVAIQLESNEAK
jgi:hypothetical protein